MKKGGGGEPGGELATAIKRRVRQLRGFQDKVRRCRRTKRFGSGWAWLLVADGKLAIESTREPGQSNLDGGKAFFGIDVWEHAYYLKYQNRRPEYLEEWWNTVNWAQVAENYAEAKK